MQKFTLTKLVESADGSELAKTWQLLRHHAEYTNTLLKVRFSSETLPAYHHSEVTKVYQHPRAGVDSKNWIASVNWFKRFDSKTCLQTAT